MPVLFLLFNVAIFVNEMAHHLANDALLYGDWMSLLLLILLSALKR